MVRWGSPVQSRPRAQKKITVHTEERFYGKFKEERTCRKDRFTVHRVQAEELYTNKLELMKYCPFEHKHTLHRETKIK